MSGDAAELERLLALYQAGALTDSEFAAAKARLLGGGSSSGRSALFDSPESVAASAAHQALSSSRRRWPIVLVVLVALVAMVVGGVILATRSSDSGTSAAAIATTTTDRQVTTIPGSPPTTRAAATPTIDPPSVRWASMKGRYLRRVKELQDKYGDDLDPSEVHPMCRASIPIFDLFAKEIENATWPAEVQSQMRGLDQDLQRMMVLFLYCTQTPPSPQLDDAFKEMTDSLKGITMRLSAITTDLSGN